MQPVGAIESVKVDDEGGGGTFPSHNLLLVAEYYNVDMAQAQVVQAKLFDNPVITLEQNIYNRLTVSILIWEKKESPECR